MTSSPYVRGAVVSAIFTAAIIMGMVHIREQAQLRTAGLLADSLEASRDTTRQLRDLNHVVADGSQVFQRRMVQAEQRADALDRELKQQRAAKGTITTRIASIDTTVPSVERIGGTVGAYPDTLRFAIRRPPYLIGAFVMPRPFPEPSEMSLNIQLDPLPQRFRIGCGPPNPANHGMRPVALTVLTPKWAKAVIDSVEVTPETCNPKKATSWLRDWKTWTLAGALTLKLFD